MATILGFCEGFPETTFRPGDVLLSEWESTGRLHILLEGEVEILQGDFQVTTVSEPGAMFGEMAILLEITHTATVKALTPCRVIVIERGIDFLQSNSTIAYQLAQHVTKRAYGVFSLPINVA